MLSCKIFWRGSNENYRIDDTMIKAIRPPFLQGILVFNLICSVLKKSGKLNNSLISLQENKNLNHHSIVGCTSGYKNINKHRNDLQQNLWCPFTIHFLNRNCFKSGSHLRTERIGLLTASSLMHEKHFHADAMSRGSQRVNLSQRREDLIVESDSSMNQTLNYGENHFRLEIWSQISYLISSLKTAFHRLQKLKENIVHPPVKSVKPNIQQRFTRLQDCVWRQKISGYFSSNQHRQGSACKASNQWYSCSSF